MPSSRSASPLSLQPPVQPCGVPGESASRDLSSTSSGMADSQPSKLRHDSPVDSPKPLNPSSRLINTHSFSNLRQTGEKKPEPATEDTMGQENTSPISALLKKLSEQTKGMDKAKTGQAKPGVVTERQETFDVSSLQKQLEEAQSKIAQMGQELTQQRHAQQSLEHALSAPASARLSPPDGHGQLAAGPGPGITDNLWDQHPVRFPEMDSASVPDNLSQMSAHSLLPSPMGWSQGFGMQGRSQLATQPQRPMNGRYDSANTASFIANGFHSQPARQPFGGGWGSFGPPSAPSPPVTPMSFAGLSSGFRPPFPPRQVGGAPSATLVDFNGGCGSVFGGGSMSGGSMLGNPWNTNPSQLNPNAQHYVPPVEPINYRRLLDRNMSCNWKYIVEKIVCNNDQQASIFLQQKLKVSTQEQKFELVEAIIGQAFALMINRFGNFLIQRCFEHGTPEQVIAIANAIRGKTLDLSMDAFGCHVVQKAFDVVPEEYKALMVHELLRRIPETVVHRYACHVWQKLFELRWSESPPQIMIHVNKALKDMWHEVALGETGSLVVQNIFENCLEEDKRPCIEEVLASIDIVSHGQFGNWCIQHICEHGAPADKRRATEHVLRFATEYSTDQFASKVVEKCLKVGGSDFLDRYLDKVCEGRSDRPRMPLIDIAGDQYGNYLIQHILLNAEHHHRELVAQHVRKHMVSLRGSKFGSRVAMLCTNPASQTRPGPPTTLPVPNAPFYAGAGHMQPNFGQRMGFGLGRGGDYR